MFWTILALGMTVVMGAIIAYYGDLIGRKYGKKRLSWFGLRPKYTAILITSLSGALISTLTMAVLFLLVPPVRDIIMKGEFAIRHLAASESDLRQANNRVVATQAKIPPLEARLSRLISQLEGDRNKLRDVHNQLVEVQKDRDIARSERDRAHHLEQQAMSRYAQVVARIGELRAKVGDLEQQRTTLTTSNRELAQANVTLHESNDKLHGENLSLSTHNAALTTENQRQAKLNTEYTNQNAEIARQNETLSRENVQLEKKRNEIAQRTKELSDYNADLEERNAKLVESARQILGGYKSLREAYNASRFKRVVIHNGEDLARVVVPARSSPDTVRSLVQTLLSDASHAAVSRGAAPGDQARAVQVVDRLVAAGEDGEIPIAMSGEERVDELVRRLSYQPLPMCIQAIAVANSVEEETAVVELLPRTNKEIFSKGQQVAMQKIDAGQAVDKLFDEVVGFLRSMGQTAVKQGVIPRTDSSGEPQVGSLSASEIARLVEQVREYNGYVRIRAIAASNIHAADPLALTFKVSP